jgi:hypothetical protein
VQAGPSAPAKQQKKKNGEDQRTASVAQNVDEQRLVESEHGQSGGAPSDHCRAKTGRLPHIVTKRPLAAQ